MSATVTRNAWGAVVGRCSECPETCSGSPSMVALWADVHNSNHRHDLAAPEQELADDYERNDHA